MRLNGAYRSFDLAIVTPVVRLLPLLRRPCDLLKIQVDLRSYAIALARLHGRHLWVSIS
ncbi:hypothetical protein [Rhizobium rhizogenes]|uniref:hypothetical protein n=1 Tax=Rhizobium rhizogenes TaxID=359 RepID=UPI001402A007|nr:hypothetical protein [Rhizobium rhizogenes]